MIRLVAISVLSAALAISLAARSANAAEAGQAIQQCAAPLSAYQAVSQLGAQVDPVASLGHPAMTLSPGQTRSLQIEASTD